eukprot:Plantae.Rhodophyta-Hildenbrandia_rubra.ctg1093.p3 GENE.Plantae.Rhodophyta-Hildenbrandia_rubra.ctg1093~~Plantae.Rhodophyta-Hildenbrandia_rubra.ctg1093.p3  ORF type:complete len:111 (-),score=25.95 Plantae.Rhodophyta-Hildenbrandia_rubra.ctg1093:1833-2165(-)
MNVMKVRDNNAPRKTRSGFCFMAMSAVANIDLSPNSDKKTTPKASVNGRSSFGAVNLERKFGKRIEGVAMVAKGVVVVGVGVKGRRWRKVRRRRREKVRRVRGFLRSVLR